MHSGTFLKTSAAAFAAVTLTCVGGLSGVAQAADTVKAAPVMPAWDLLFGVTATSDYVTRGLDLSSGAAIQPWAELDVGPVYFGYWGSNIDPAVGSGGTASWENDLSIGIRGSQGPFGWDVGYVRYVYSPSTADFGEVYGKATINPVTPLTLGASVFYSPDLTTTYVEGNAKLALMDNISLSGAIGSQDGTSSWNAGASWAPLDYLTLDGRYYGGPTSNKFVVSIAFSTSLSKVRAGKY
jgi:uncharacterized protein (TIGR02001 family)